MRSSFLLLIPTLLILSGYPLAAQQEYQQIDHYLELINDEFSGEAARRITGYVSERWRLPGNRGFNASIHDVRTLLEAAGFTESDQPLSDKMTYRIERHPLRLPAWEPVSAQLRIVGEEQALLSFATNRNMIAINSFSTAAEGMEAELVYLPACDPSELEKLEVKGKIVMSDCHSQSLFRLAVQKFGAAGVLSYSIPAFNQPERYINSIPFTSIPFQSEIRSWGLNLSYAAKERLLRAQQAGPVQLHVEIETRILPGEELALIAEIPGGLRPEERFVYSAHVQEPGANDNASGVGALAEMARVAAKLWQNEQVRPARTLTFIWGDEIDATRRYIREDEQRAKGIRWGMSLDMVGEDTEKTGGTFLIEKMPDPSAIWTRGEDQHTEWGSSPVSEEDFNPHYFNDITEAICRRQAQRSGWVVKTNPFEGGSDHQPFLDAGIPGLLFWHFTDVFYHTDADRIDKVSANTLKNVGCSALASGFLLTSGRESAVQSVLHLTDVAAHKRLEAESALSRSALKEGAVPAEEQKILQSWLNWYATALPKVTDILVDSPPTGLEDAIARKLKRLREKGEEMIREIGER